jgi:hypothetical protein
MPTCIAHTYYKSTKLTVLLTASQVIFFVRIFADVLGRFLPRLRAFNPSSPYTPLLVSCVKLIGVPIFLLYLKSPPRLHSDVAIGACATSWPSWLLRHACHTATAHVALEGGGTLGAALPALPAPQFASWAPCCCAVLFVTLMWVMGGYINTMSNVLAPRMVPPQVGWVYCHQVPVGRLAYSMKCLGLVPEAHSRWPL